MKKSESGFTIIEVVLAIGVVTLIVVSLVGLIVPIQEGIREGSLTATASRMMTVLEAKLNSDDGTLSSLVESDSALVAVYQVRVKPGFTYDTDPVEADLNRDLQGGIEEGYRIAPVARRSWEGDEVASWNEDADAIDGPAFLVQVRLETEGRLQPDQLSGENNPEVLVLNCTWYELPIGVTSQRWNAIINQRPILKTPLVLRP